jgi:hypothetical protein
MEAIGIGLYLWIVDFCITWSFPLSVSQSPFLYEQQSYWIRTYINDPIKYSHIFKGPVSKYRHILHYQLQHMNWKEGHNSVYNIL